MYDCNAEVGKFHDQRVRLPQKTQDLLRTHRRANQERLRKGLKASEGPPVCEFVKQGSYAMYTINQAPKNDYDIDDGAVFASGDLVGPRGGELSALDARKLVRAAIDDGSFKSAPEVRDNCVRVFYEAGHHVDIPVYRATADPSNGDGRRLELASSAGWRPSDPRAVTTWFNEAVAHKSPDTTNGQQMRRVVRLLKCFSKSRESWRSPSGFILSVLVNEGYVARVGRDDVSLYETMDVIHRRLQSNLYVWHPVLPEALADESKAGVMRDFRDRLGKALKDLDVLEDPDCTQKAALKAWSKVFATDFFADEIAGRSLAGLAVTGTPESAVEKLGGGRFG